MNASRVAERVRRALLYPLAFCGYLSFAAVFQVFPPFFDELQEEFDVGRTVAGLTMTSFLVPLVATAFAVGAATDRHGHRRVGGLGCLILLAGGGVTVVAQSLPALLAARAVAGLGGGMMLVALLSLLAVSFPAARLGIAFGVFIAGLPAGSGLAFDVFNHLGGWRESAAAAEALTALVAVFFFAAVAGGAPSRALASQQAPPAGARRTLRHLAVLVGLGYMAIIGFTTWAPSRLEGYAELSAGATAAIASVLLLIDLPAAPFWGRLSDRVGRRKPFVIAAFVVYGIGALFVPSVAAPSGLGVAALVALVATMGIGCAMFFPVTLAIPPTLVPPSLVGKSYGLFLTAQAAGMAAGPLLFGAIFTWGSVPLGFYLIGVAALLGAVVSLPLRSS